jgi:uncharacterized membrane protein YdbT with pleckstrin-like domain
MTVEDSACESVVIEVRQHPVVLIRALVVNAAALAVLIGLSRTLGVYWLLLLYLIPLVILLFEVALWKSRKFRVTPSEVIKEESLFPSASVRLPLKEIKNVVHGQTILGRIFRYGSVKLEVDQREEILAFYFIPGPVEFASHILQRRHPLEG